MIRFVFLAILVICILSSCNTNDKVVKTSESVNCISSEIYESTVQPYVKEKVAQDIFTVERVEYILDYAIKDVAVCSGVFNTYHQYETFVLNHVPEFSDMLKSAEATTIVFEILKTYDLDVAYSEDRYINAEEFEKANLCQWFLATDDAYDNLDENQRNEVLKYMALIRDKCVENDRLLIPYDETVFFGYLSEDSSSKWKE